MPAKTIKIFFQIVKKLLSCLVTTVVIYLLIAVILSFLKTKPPEINCVKEREVFVTTNGVHLDIIIPVEELDYEFKRQLALTRGTKFVAFGWGDKGFYISTPEWSDLTFPTAFKALFLKSHTAMHVTCYNQSYQSWRKVIVCNEQLDVLLIYIFNSFKKDTEGKIQKINVNGYGNNDSFFESKGSFSIFKTCNVWTNIALKRSGVETSIWSPFDFGVIYHLPE